MGRRKRRAQAKKQTKNQQPQAASELRESARKAPTQRRSLPALLQKEWCQISLVFGVALLLRVLNILFMRESSPFYDMPATDSALYDAVAKTLAKGNWLGDEVFYYNPFYPYFLGLLYALFGESYTVVKVIQAFIGSASAVLVFVIAKRLFDRPVALIAGGIAAAYGVFIFYDELLLAATVSISLLLLAMHLLLRAGERPSIRRFSAAGFLVGLAFLSRPTVFPLVAVLWVIYRLRKERVSFIAVRLAVLGTAAALMIAPVIIRNYAVGDDLVLISSHTGSNIYLGNHEDSNGYFVLPRSMPRTLIDNPTDVRDYFKKMAEEDIGRELKPSEVSQYWSAKGFEYISSHPVDWLKLAGQKLMRLVNEYESSDNQSYYFSKQYSPVLTLPLFGYGFVLPLALLGMILAFRQRERLALLYLFVAAYSASLVLFFVTSRYRMLMVPYLIMFAAFAVRWLTERLREQRFAPFLKAAALLGLFIAVAFINIQGVSKEPQFIDYYNMANKYLNKGRFEEAIDAYQQSIEIRRDYLSSHNNLANAYQRSGQIEKAREKWRDVLELAKRKGSEQHIQRAKRKLMEIERLR